MIIVKYRTARFEALKMDETYLGYQQCIPLIVYIYVVYLYAHYALYVYSVQVESRYIVIN